jgi:putative transposase
METYQVSERRACAVLGVNRTSLRRRSTRDQQEYLRKRIREIAAVRVRYGYRRIHVLLQREGWLINHKRVYRLYREEGLHLERKSRYRKKYGARVPSKAEASAANECWSMDFVSDQMYNGKRFRALTVLDVYTRECPAIYADQSIRGEHVAHVLDGIAALRGLPKRIKVDNGPEFISRAMHGRTSMA